MLENAGPLGSLAFARAFCALWTRKESVMKLTGRGLAEPLPDLLGRHATDAVTETLPLGNPDASPGSGFLSLSLWKTTAPLAREDGADCVAAPAARATTPVDSAAPLGSSFRLVRVSPGELLAQ